jgi:hypothetical protein
MNLKKMLPDMTEELSEFHDADEFLHCCFTEFLQHRTLLMLPLLKPKNELN